MKYKLNPHYRLDFIDSLEVQPEYTLDAKNLEAKSILINENKDSVYLINDSIYQFLQLFNVPISWDKVCENYSFEDEYESLNAQKIVRSFFESMLQRKIIIQENEIPKERKKEYKYVVGSVLGNYNISEQIANKSGVDIYACEDNSGNKWALKLVHSGKFQTEKSFLKAKNSLQQEYKVLQDLSDISAVVNTMEIVENEEDTFLVMEFIDGENLSKFIKSNDATLLLQVRFKLINQLLETFSEIHALEIIHSDIHASNFVIQNEYLRVLDFGNSHQSIPKENEIIKRGGVAYYMPPERIDDNIFHKFKNQSTLKSEVYQLGILMYFILYGKTPFSGFTWKNLSEQIKHQTPIFERKISTQEKIPSKWVEFIQKALSKDPKDRFDSAIIMNEEWKKLQKLEKEFGNN